MGIYLLRLEEPTDLPSLGSPSEERDTIDSLQRNLERMRGYIGDYLAALGLSEDCRQAQVELRKKEAAGDTAAREIAQGWGDRRRIAHRDATMTVYHFGCAIKGINESLPLCAWIANLADRKLLKDGRKQFQQQFPRWEDARDAVAHSTDPTRNPRAYDAHAVKGGSAREVPGLIRMEPAFKGTVVVSGAIVGDELVNSWDGDFSMQKLDSSSSNAMVAVYRKFCGAMAPISVELRRRRQDLLQAPSGRDEPQP